ncbi:MAG: hypothetical protein DDT30_01288 [Dehalococcoidia bacterium]|nr:hypothetical protein [Bacillota bacterium]
MLSLELVAGAAHRHQVDVARRVILNLRSEVKSRSIAKNTAPRNSMVRLGLPLPGAKPRQRKCLSFATGDV